MRKAIVSVTVDVELSIDTDSPVAKLDPNVLNEVRKMVGSAVDYVLDTGSDFDVLGHYIERASATKAKQSGRVSLVSD